MISKRRVEFFGSALCPRCRMVRKALQEMAPSYPELQIIEIDAVRRPLYALRQGIRLIPALQSGREHLSGVFLTRQQVRIFLDRLADSA